MINLLSAGPSTALNCMATSSCPKVTVYILLPQMHIFPFSTKECLEWPQKLLRFKTRGRLTWPIWTRGCSIHHGAIGYQVLAMWCQGVQMTSRLSLDIQHKMAALGLTIFTWVSPSFFACLLKTSTECQTLAIRDTYPYPRQWLRIKGIKADICTTLHTIHVRFPRDKLLQQQRASWSTYDFVNRFFWE